MLVAYGATWPRDAIARFRSGFEAKHHPGTFRIPLNVLELAQIVIFTQ